MLNQKQLNRTLFIFAALLFSSFVFPLHSPPFRTYYHELLGALSVICALGSMTCLPQIKLTIPKLVILPVGLIIIIAIQTKVGLILFPVDMVFPVLTLLCFICAQIFGATVAAQDNGIEKLSMALALAFVVTGLVSVILQHIQLLDLHWRPLVFPLLSKVQVRPYGNLAQPNLLALLLCFSVASIWYIYLKEKIKPIAGLVIVVFLLWGLALTQSRIAWIILPIFFAGCWQPPAHTRKIPGAVLSALLLCFVAFVFVLPYFFSLFGLTIESLKEHAGQTSVRTVLWQQALQMSFMHPWMGAGWYQFGPQQILLSTYFSPAEYADNAHNIVMNFVAEIGWPSTVLIVVGMAYWFYSCCIRHWQNLQVRFMSLTLLAVAVHSMVEYPMWFCFVLMPCGVMLGALHVENLGLERVVVSRKALIAFFVAAAIIGADVTWDYVRVVYGFVALNWQQEGKKTGLGSTEKPEFTLLPQFYDYFRILKIDVAPGISKEDLKFVEQLSLRFGHPVVLNRLALIYANNEKPNEALQVLITMQRLFRVQYVDSYADWKKYAQLSPELYGEIFKRLPQPDTIGEATTSK